LCLNLLGFSGTIQPKENKKNEEKQIIENDSISSPTETCIPESEVSSCEDFIPVGLLQTSLRQNHAANIENGSSPEVGLYCFETDLDSSSEEEVSATKPPKRLSQAQRLRREKEKHPLLPPCSCRRECINKLGEQFWTMNYNSRKTWINQRVTRRETKSHQSRCDVKRRRTETREYTLRDRHGDVQTVCKEFFMRTLGYMHDSFLTAICRSTERGDATPPPDKRGRHEPSNKLTTEARSLIEKHIESYCPSVPHYRREHAPNRRYLAPELNVTIMFNDFKEKHPTCTCGIDTYRKTVAAKNISFVKLGQEECDVCLAYSNHIHETSLEQETQKCTHCDKWKIHIEEARLSRTKYQEDAAKDTDTIHLSADMQKVLLLPRMPSLKSCFFLKKLVVFHETFAPIGSSKKNGKKPRVLSCLWNESISGRNACDVASSFEKALTFYMQNTSKVVIWADNCSAQNKNWTLYTALNLLVNDSENGYEDIELQYLEPGHTFMAADSFHAQVERSMRRVKNHYNMDDIADTIERSGGGPKVIQMGASDFRLWENGLSKKKIRPKLASIRAAKFTRGMSKLQFKQSHSEDSWQTYEFLREDLVIPKNCDKERGIPPDRGTIS